jgi:hypothetical protein
MFFAYIPAGTGFPGVPGPPITAPPQPRSRVDRNPAAVFRAAVNGYERGQIALYSGQD